MDRSNFKNRRVRFQRIKDAKFFTGWVRAFSNHGLIVTVNSPVSVSTGEVFSFQIYAEGVSGMFKGSLTVHSNTELSFNIVDQPKLIKNEEEMRLQVQEMTGIVQGSFGECQVLVVDVSANGVGVLLSEPVEKGDQVQLSIESPQGQVIFAGEIRYCRKNPSSFGQYRAGLAISPVNRVDAVRWQRLLQNEAA